MKIELISIQKNIDKNLGFYSDKFESLTAKAPNLAE
jgi:hypothetical protein